jgi:hypothetical protein
MMFANTSLSEGISWIAFRVADAGIAVLGCHNIASLEN